MSKNVYQNSQSSNGNDSLLGCPTDWKQAKAWTKLANKNKEDYEYPNWSWDCNYKLDFDGPLISVSSRFYPPRLYYGPTWDGSVRIKVLDKVVVEKKFDCITLDELKLQVEKFVYDFAAKIVKLSH